MISAHYPHQCQCFFIPPKQWDYQWEIVISCIFNRVLPSTNEKTGTQGGRSGQRPPRCLSPRDACGKLRVEANQHAARRTREGAQGTTTREDALGNRGTGERVRHPRQGHLGAAHPQGVRSRSARMPEVPNCKQRADAGDRVDRRSEGGAAYARLHSWKKHSSPAASSR